MTSLCRAAPDIACRVTAVIDWSASVAPVKIACPASVSTIRLLKRMNSCLPRKLSRFRTCWLTAAADTLSSSAAAT